MQQEHRLALTKNYVLLVNETPVDEIMDHLVQEQIVNEEQREFIAHHATRKARTRALLNLLPRRGPKAFYAFCYALLSKKRNDLVMVLTDEETEDMEVCFPEHSRFHLGGDVYLKAEQDGITLAGQKGEIYFPLVRWVKLQYTMDDIDEAVHYLKHNRYASLDRHLGGNVYVTAESPALSLNIRHYYWCEDNRYSTSDGITLDFEQYEKLKEADRMLADIVSGLKNTLPCEFSHQNVEGAMYCSECSPNGPDTL